MEWPRRRCIEAGACLSVVGFNLRRGDTDAGAEALLDEAEDFKPEAKIGIHTIGGEIVHDEESHPSGVRGAVLVNAGRKFLTDFCQACVDFGVGGRDCLDVFAANLLLNEGLADELVECSLWGEVALSGADGVEDREANLFVDVAREDDMAVDDGDYAVEDYGEDGDAWARASCVPAATKMAREATRAAPRSIPDRVVGATRIRRFVPG